MNCVFPRFAGFGLNCYKCNSGESWGECDAKQQNITCGPDHDRCSQFHVEAKMMGSSRAFYIKSCTTSATCKTAVDGNCRSIVGGDPSIEISKCEPNCCSGDLCNGGKVPMDSGINAPIVSAIMLMTCALVAFIR